MAGCSKTKIQCTLGRNLHMHSVLPWSNLSDKIGYRLQNKLGYCLGLDPLSLLLMYMIHSLSFEYDILMLLQMCLCCSLYKRPRAWKQLSQTLTTGGTIIWVDLHQMNKSVYYRMNKRPRKRRHWYCCLGLILGLGVGISMKVTWKTTF